jgi:hypothetical protein
LLGKATSQRALTISSKRSEVTHEKRAMRWK